MFCHGRKTTDAFLPSRQVQPAHAAATAPTTQQHNKAHELSNTNRKNMKPCDMYDFRSRSSLPSGGAMYIQSGDTSDFDGYLIAAAGQVLQSHTSKLQFIIAVPERRAWRDKTEPDTSKHDPEYSEEVMATAGQLLRQLCPTANLTRGVLNTRNLIPWKMMFNEPELYGPLIKDLGAVDIRWSSLKALADQVMSPAVTSIVLDMNGSMGYLDGLVTLLGPKGEKVLGAKMKASGLPVVVMAGIQAEVVPQTLPLPGRDPRATKNAIYYAAAVRVMLRLAKNHGVPLLFVTNNTCNALLKFQDAEEVASELGLQGLLRRINDTWFSMPHLKGKCVPFDWVAFSAMLLYGRQPSEMTIVRQQLWVGKDDPAVLVLRDAGQPLTDAVTTNLKDTELWGQVDCVADIPKTVMCELAKYAAANAACNTAPAAEAKK